MPQVSRRMTMPVTPSYAPSPLLSDEAIGHAHHKNIGRSSQCGRNVSTREKSKIRTPIISPTEIAPDFVKSGSPGRRRTAVGSSNHPTTSDNVTARRAGTRVNIAIVAITQKYIVIDVKLNTEWKPIWSRPRHLNSTRLATRMDHTHATATAHAPA